MVVLCTSCYTEAKIQDDRYYNVRLTSTGIDFDAGLDDKLLCESCLNIYMSSQGVKYIQSIIRIKNPMS